MNATMSTSNVKACETRRHGDGRWGRSGLALGQPEGAGRMSGLTRCTLSTGHVGGRFAASAGATARIEDGLTEA